MSTSIDSSINANAIAVIDVSTRTLVESEEFEHLSKPFYDSIISNIQYATARKESFMNEIRKRDSYNRNKYAFVKANVKQHIKDLNKHYDDWISAIETNIANTPDNKHSQDYIKSLRDECLEVEVLRENVEKVAESELLEKYHQEHFNEPGATYDNIDDTLYANATALQDAIVEHHNSLTKYVADCVEAKAENKRQLQMARARYPRSRDDIIRHMYEFNRNIIHEQFSELFEFYCDLIIEGLGINGYESTIKSVIVERGKSNFRKAFEFHDASLIQQLNELAKVFVNELDNEDVVADDYYHDAEEQLQKRITTEITQYYAYIAQWMNRKINEIIGAYRITSEDNSNVIKTYTREVIMKIMTLLESDVNEVRERFESTRELRSERSAVIPTGEPKTTFIDEFTHGTEYTIQDVANKWNEFHKTSLSNMAVSKQKLVLESFDKNRKTINKKQTMAYTLK